MKNKKVLFLAFLLVLVLFFTVSVMAQKELPIGLQKIIEYNNQKSAEFATNISFFIAFVAGILGILSPCILPFLPAYFSYTFKEKRNITLMTFVFFLGFSLVFVSMGVIAGFIGEQSLAVLQNDLLVNIAGLFLIFLGFISLSGKGFSSIIKPNHKFKNDIPGVFLLGIFFAIGWSACLGPILAGILGIGVILHNLWYSALLLFFYSLGNFVPLFVLSVFYDRYNLSKNRFIKGKMLKFHIVKKKFHVHSTNLISGILFLIIGIFLIIYKGTGPLNKFDIFGTKFYFYSIQNSLMSWEYANLFSIVVFILFMAILARFLLKNKKK